MLPRDKAFALEVRQTVVAANTAGQVLVQENYDRIAFILSSDAGGVFRLGIKFDGTALDGIILTTTFPRLEISWEIHRALVWQQWVATTNTISNITVIETILSRDPCQGQAAFSRPPLPQVQAPRPAEPITIGTVFDSNPIIDAIRQYYPDYEG